MRNAVRGNNTPRRRKRKTTCLLRSSKCKFSVRQRLVLVLFFFLSSYRNTVLNQSTCVFALGYFLNVSSLWYAQKTRDETCNNTVWENKQLYASELTCNSSGINSLTTFSLKDRRVSRIEVACEHTPRPANVISYPKPIN